MTIDKQALRQLAIDAYELGIIKRYTKGIEANMRFVAIATPLTVLALLDELEASENCIAELKVEKETLRPVGVMSEKAFYRLERSESQFIALWPGREFIYQESAHMTELSFMQKLLPLILA